MARAVALSAVALLVGLAADGSPRAGLLAVPLIPVAGGIGIVEAAYERLVGEVRGAARRVVEAEDASRRRIERDLHDGAQHRLVVLGMSLGELVHRASERGDPELAAAAESARAQPLAATAELRELARGIHPSVLTQDGLAAALESIADRSSIPVTVTVAGPGTCSAEADTTAYFVVSEALTNAARHSGAGQIAVVVHRDGPLMRIEVRDDGRGGAEIGGGLRGLADRVVSLGGELTVHSPAGDGTRLVVELPCP